MLYAGEHAGVLYETRVARGRRRAAGHVERYVLRASDGGGGGPDRTRSGARALALSFGIVESDGRSGAAPYALADVTAVAFDRAAGHVAVRHVAPFARAHFEREALRMHVDGCELGAGHTRGAVETGARRITWDLTFDVLAPPHTQLAHPWMYATATPRMKVASPFPDVRVSGAVTVDGVPWAIDRWAGSIGHTWGARHADAYAWAHVNAWDEGDELLVEAVAAQDALGPLALPLATSVVVRYRGVRYALNGPVDLARNGGDISARRFRFEASSPQIEVSGELWAETDDFVGLHLESPRGAPLHVLTTEIARARVELAVRGGPAAIFHARAGGLELGTTNPDHGVRMHL